MKDIVFIHGMFQNPKSWEKWIKFFSEKGYNCVAPAWPLHYGEPANLRANPPAGLGDLSLNEIINAMESIVQQYDQPIVIGHSVGGLVAQILVNRKSAGVGVPISSVAPNGMLDFDWGFFKNSALIANPFKGNEPFFMDAEGFHGSFANTLSADENDIAYQNFATHDSRNVLRDCMGEDGKIDLDVPHAPLLFIAGEKDEIIPYTLNEKNAKAYTDEYSLVAYQMFENRSHFICGEPGWEEVATTIYDWLQTLPENK
jgi:pimeloyl-ACP methyl ester carboxylesterase